MKSLPFMCPAWLAQSLTNEAGLDGQAVRGASVPVCRVAILTALWKIDNAVVADDGAARLPRTLTNETGFDGRAVGGTSVPVRCVTVVASLRG